MSRALYTLNILAGLALPVEHRAAVLCDLYAAAGQPAPDGTLAARLVARPAAALGALPLDAAGQQRLATVLCSPSFSVALSEALARVSGGARPPPPPPPGHPLGEDAAFPPQVAAALGMLGPMVDGAPVAVPGFAFSSHILGFREALRRPRPSRALILGAGYVGAELALGWASQGCTVTLLDRRQDLMRGYIPAQAHRVRQMLESAGVTVQLGHQALRWARKGPDIAVYTRAVLGESTQLVGPIYTWRAAVLVVAAGVR